jgi:nucleotide-binding universal stress UspA family protein
MFLNILVALDGSPSSLRALEQAVDLAQAGNAKLTIVTVAPPASSYVALGGLSPASMQDELDTWAHDILTAAAASVPDDVVVHTVQRSGRAGPQVVEELATGGYDLLVLGTRGRGRAQEGLLGSVNGYAHFHAKVPILTVPDEPG